MENRYLLIIVVTVFFFNEENLVSFWCLFYWIQTQLSQLMYFFIYTSMQLPLGH